MANVRIVRNIPPEELDSHIEDKGLSVSTSAVVLEGCGDKHVELVDGGNNLIVDPNKVSINVEGDSNISLNHSDSNNIANNNQIDICNQGVNIKTNDNSEINIRSYDKKGTFFIKDYGAANEDVSFTFSDLYTLSKQFNANSAFTAETYVTDCFDTGNRLLLVIKTDVSFNKDISSNIFPKYNNTLDLGSTDKRWKTLC